MVKNGTIYRLVADHLGSIKLVIDVAIGTVAQKLEYDEFGNVLSDSNPDFQPFAYAGGLYDAQTKLVRFGARDYEASSGRWTAKDPIGFGGGVSNLFEYVVNDPINNYDPEGFKRYTHDEIVQLVKDNNKSGQSDEMIVALIWKESGFDSDAKNSSSSAIGLMQITKAAAKDAGYTYDDASTDPATNIQAGTSYLKLRIDWAKGDVTNGLNGYGTGTGYSDNIQKAVECMKNSPCEAKKCLEAIHK